MNISLIVTIGLGLLIGFIVIQLFTLLTQLIFRGSVEADFEEDNEASSSP